MIGKITTGGNFSKLFEYLFKKNQGAALIANNSFSDDPQKIAEEYNLVASRNSITTKPVKHIIVAFAPEDGRVEDKVKIEIAQEIVNSLGYTDNQWCVVKHNRKNSKHDWEHDHDHMHIAINAITFNGRRIKDGFDKTRLEKILRNLETQYKLKSVISSDHRQFRRPKQNRYKRFQEAYKKWELELKTNPSAQPPKEPEIQSLEAIIAAAVEDRPTIDVYLARLQTLGYKAELYQTKPTPSQKPRKRIRYHLRSSSKKVTRIKGGSLAQLQKLGVTYDESKDDIFFDLVKQNRKIPIPDEKLLTYSQIKKHKFLWLDKNQRETILQTSKLKKQSSRKNKQFDL